MEIIAKTLLTNKTKKERHLIWARVCLDPEETRIIDGLFPSACKNPSDVKMMQADIATGNVGVVLITNLPVSKPEKAKRIGEAPGQKEKGVAPVKPDGTDTRTAMNDEAKAIDQGVFVKGSIEGAKPKEVLLKQDMEDAPTQMGPKETVFFGGEDPRGAVPDPNSDDPLQSLGKIKAPEITKGAAELVNGANLSTKQMAKLTNNGSIPKINKRMVKHFLVQEGLIDEGEPELVGAGEAKAPDQNSFD